MSHSARDAGLKLLREHALIDGKAVTGGKTIAVDDPATGEVLGSVPDLGEAETQQAIDAADRAFEGWSGKRPDERAAFLREWARLIDENAEGLAGLMALELVQDVAKALASGAIGRNLPMVVTAGTGGTVFVALQLAKHVYGAGSLVTSTSGALLECRGAEQ